MHRYISRILSQWEFENDRRRKKEWHYIFLHYYKIVVRLLILISNKINFKIKRKKEIFQEYKITPRKHILSKRYLKKKILLRRKYLNNISQKKFMCLKTSIQYKWTISYICVIVIKLHRFHISTIKEHKNCYKMLLSEDRLLGETVSRSIFHWPYVIWF